ncbi:MSHA pilin protein MshC [Duganella sp. CF458]|uniref:prepilin-type N-terminal cleavage/methylation domain-containing protein n=1 Tax=Duganella sp. CF458 TaxID=1884368 RepID=UPI0008F0E7B7|nr:prepilin-type N-terminal cleavage/methylation domain-containing protein [Duganella sp. CF458]SFG63619.1 MSHA pilin protein MshC [Duganella sp. CF458]
MATRAVSRGRGFTMVELIVVLVVIGILSAVAFNRFFDRGGYTAAGFAAQVKATLRYGQKLAIAQNRPIYVYLDSTSVALCFAASCSAANHVRDPGGGNGYNGTAQCSSDRTWACVAPPANVALVMSPANAANNHFYFDAGGKPQLQSGAEFASLNLQVRAGSDQQAVRVQWETGYVY